MWSSIRTSKSSSRSRRRNVARLTPALLLAALLSPAPIPAQDAPREVERLERDLVAAIGRVDLATYDRMVADDNVAFLPEGGESSNAEILASDRSGGRARAPLTGNWGGDHVGMQATDRGASLDFDCARGSIDGTITPDEQGRFDVPGKYVQEGPGPVRPDQLRGKSARYSGKVEGKTMTLSVELSETDVSIGTFTLVRDRLPRVRKCG